MNVIGQQPARRQFHLSTLIATALMSALTIPPALAWFFRRYATDPLDVDPTRFWIALAIFAIAALFALYWFALIVEVIIARRELARQREQILSGLNINPDDATGAHSGAPPSSKARS
jgi:hypothetical protein